MMLKLSVLPHEICGLFLELGDAGPAPLDLLLGFPTPPLGALGHLRLLLVLVLELLTHRQGVVQRLGFGLRGARVLVWAGWVVRRIGD